jgi:hypothetical protein
VGGTNVRDRAFARNFFKKCSPHSEKRSTQGVCMSQGIPEKPKINSWVDYSTGIMKKSEWYFQESDNLTVLTKTKALESQWGNRIENVNVYFDRIEVPYIKERNPN